ncbi:MAG: CPBP family intramembrane metalloprotease [Bacteroidales bacterium]|nr:MAG: CPBP family intramembrane metalloprotease [Bacteroidales bacterium]
MIRELKYSIIYIIVVIIISWVLVLAIFSDDGTVELYPIAMFVPAMIGIIFNGIMTKSFRTVVKPIVARVGLKTFAFSILYPLIFIICTAFLVYILGLGQVNSYKLSGLFKYPSITTLIIGALLLFGEEYGWRGFLLQNLSEARGKLFAVVAVGIVWALWHAPLIYSLGCYYYLPNPFLLMLVQMGAVFVISIPFAYSYFISRSIIPPMIFHFVWNWYNPIILGNIYQNKLGIVEGNMLFINGEGLAGLILGCACMSWFIKHFLRKKTEII